MIKLVFMLLMQIGLIFAKVSANASEVCNSIENITTSDWQNENHDSIEQYVRMNTKESMRLAIWLGAKPVVFQSTKWYVDAQHEYLNTLLYAAIARGETLEITKLVSQGADVNSDSSLDDYLTPLITAVRCSSSRIVNELIDFGAKVNAVATYSPNENVVVHDTVALIWASERGDLAIVNQLLAAGANPNAQERLANVEVSRSDTVRPGSTPLLTNPPAVVMAELLSHGANPNTLNSLGESPLMLAAEEGSQEKCILLLKSGANKAIRNVNGETALQLARSLRHFDVAKIVENYKVPS